ncbi:hypothetical protein [Cryptosporidium parvum Iowa II]|uniref:Uncharacterized protein n=2 Tax=Cryptosporidium parvum TaxID=5807 RepID=Q5CPT8_CRYPI|nr:hypothetical protein [Cryptosporidium parvum Iowa II]EAK87434.1 hypothetical protein cgd4_4070 [Cryptosporidium parvum Iowa II]QOY42307.1 hypothetical protein CPATCC_0021380 [Cryptosporidium parvum]WRK31717.1 hypothetical protein cpbgf_4004070 [Cryptosporidium parvum]|eukprot:QOY42307.1 hypothetical protein CPATCC_001939 [Cryptosporidium parvum]
MSNIFSSLLFYFPPPHTLLSFYFSNIYSIYYFNAISIFYFLFYFNPQNSTQTLFFCYLFNLKKKRRKLHLLSRNIFIVTFNAYLYLIYNYYVLDIPFNYYTYMH